MKGIDISHWNGFPFNLATSNAYKSSDFCIIKATDGVSYSYAKSYFPKAMNKVLADGKLAGAYHYATGAGSPIAEADYFVSVVKPYLGKIILALDWENGGNRAWGNTTWCKQFIDRVKEKTGITCFLYTGMAGIKQARNLANTVPLWFAGYPVGAASWTVPAFPKKYSTAPWTSYTIWQFTSGGNVDRNITSMTRSQWNKYTGSNNTTPKKEEPKTPSTSKESTLDLAYRVMKGEFGTGAERKQKLGLRYAEVQAFINHIQRSATSTLVKETLEGKYGNGAVRKVVLGSRYKEVQNRINSR